MSKKSQQIELFAKTPKTGQIRPKIKKNGYQPFLGWIIQPWAANAQITLLKNKRTMKWEQKSWEDSQQST